MTIPNKYRLTVGWLRMHSFVFDDPEELLAKMGEPWVQRRFRFVEIAMKLVGNGPGWLPWGGRHEPIGWFCAGIAPYNELIPERRLTRKMRIRRWLWIRKIVARDWMAKHVFHRRKWREIKREDIG